MRQSHSHHKGSADADKNSARASTWAAAQSFLCSELNFATTFIPKHALWYEIPLLNAYMSHVLYNTKRQGQCHKLSYFELIAPIFKLMESKRAVMKA